MKPTTPTLARFVGRQCSIRLRCGWLVLLLSIGIPARSARAGEDSANDPDAPVDAPLEPMTSALDAKDQADLAHLRDFLRELHEESHDRQKWAGISSLAEGVVAAGFGGFYMLQKGDELDRTRQVGAFLVIHGAIAVGLGAILLSGPDRTYEKLGVILGEQSKTERAAVAIRATEARWAEVAQRARTTRKLAGWFAVAAGAAGVGVGLAVPAFTPEDQKEVVSLSLGAVLLSAVLLAEGVAQVSVPSDVERSWNAYRGLKTVSLPARQSAVAGPQLTFAPANGGAMGAVTMAF